MLSIEMYSGGEVLVDLIFIEKPGEGSRVEMHFGGAPANLAVGVSRLGHRAGFVGSVGDDIFGKFLINSLRMYEVDTRFTVIKRARTTLAFVVVDERGERWFFFYRKPWTETADTMLELSDVDPYEVAKARVFHFSGFSTSFPPTSETIYTLAEYSRRSGAVVSYDPTYREDVWLSREKTVEAFRRSLKIATMLSMSIDEVEYFFGETNYRYLAERILEKYPNIEVVAIRMGAKGAYVKTRHEEVYKEPFKVRVVDTTGAGDAWTAGFLVAYILEKRDLEYSVLLANAVAAIVCTRYGAITAMPTLEETINFIKQYQ